MGREQPNHKQKNNHKQKTTIPHWAGAAKQKKTNKKKQTKKNKQKKRLLYWLSHTDHLSKLVTKPELPQPSPDVRYHHPANE